MKYLLMIAITLFLGCSFPVGETSDEPAGCVTSVECYDDPSMMDDPCTKRGCEAGSCVAHVEADGLECSRLPGTVGLCQAGACQIQN